MLDEVNTCSSPEKNVLACERGGITWAFVQVEMAAMPNKTVKLLGRKLAARDDVFILVPLALEKKREKKAVREDGTVVGGREAKALKGRL